VQVTDGSVGGWALGAQRSAAAGPWWPIGQSTMTVAGRCLSQRGSISSVRAAWPHYNRHQQAALPALSCLVEPADRWIVAVLPTAVSVSGI